MAPGCSVIRVPSASCIRRALVVAFTRLSYTCRSGVATSGWWLLERCRYNNTTVVIKPTIMAAALTRNQVRTVIDLVFVEVAATGVCCRLACMDCHILASISDLSASDICRSLLWIIFSYHSSTSFSSSSVHSPARYFCNKRSKFDWLNYGVLCMT